MSVKQCQPKKYSSTSGNAVKKRKHGNKIVKILKNENAAKMLCCTQSQKSFSLVLCKSYANKRHRNGAPASFYSNRLEFQLRNEN